MGESISPGFRHAVATPGGVIHAQWDEAAQVTGSGPLVYFAQFLQASGLWPEAVSYTHLDVYKRQWATPADFSNSPAGKSPTQSRSDR